MKRGSIYIPKDDGEILSIPNPEEATKYIVTNRKIFAKWDFSIGNIPAKGFRDMARSEAYATSNRYMANFTSPTPININNNTVIVETGHQPGFHHPGVIAKYLLRNILIGKGNYVGLNLIVDSDTFKEISVEIPDDNKTKITLLSLDKPIPFESAQEIDINRFNQFLNDIKSSLNQPNLKAIKDNFEAWRDCLRKNQPISSDLTTILTHLRRLFTVEGKTKELPISKLSETKTFLIFFLHIANRGSRFAEIYNRQLSLYRKANNIRYQVYPFPDLRMEENYIEIPFWHLNNKERQKISVRTDGETISIINNSEELASIPADDFDKGIEIIRKKGIKIRPSGLTTTMFNRMFIADIFIHGTGGAKYDIVTDAVIRDFFAAEPPLYATISMTKYPQVELSDKSLQIKEIEDKLRNIEYNPDRYIDNKNPLIEEKKKLLLEINREKADKKKIGKKIRVVNNKLQSTLKEESKNDRIELNKLKEEMEIFAYIMRRNYPYFFFKAALLNNLFFE